MVAMGLPGDVAAAAFRPSRSFWHGKRVFVTGHTGFKGAWLSLWLQNLDAIVFGYGLPAPTQPSLYDVAEIASTLDHATTADICDQAALRSALRRARPDIVIHMAAQAIVLRSYDEPVETFSTNVVGTVAVLDAIRTVDSVRAVVVVTSDKCYENREWPWGYRETDPLGGHDPYSASKAAAELAVASMRHSFFSASTYATHRVAVASARAGNVIGGGDWGEFRLVPDIMRALMAGKPCVVRHPRSVRPWQHVLEPLSGYLRLAEALWQDGPTYAGAWNFGPLDANARPVSWIAGNLTRMWQGSPTWRRGQAPGPHEHSQLRLDISKARTLLGWAPTWPLETTLDSIVAWYRAYRDGACMRDVVRTQIAAFCGEAQGTAPERSLALPAGQD